MTPRSAKLAGPASRPQPTALPAPLPKHRSPSDTHAMPCGWKQSGRPGATCDPVVGRMLFAHDELFGPRTERAAFREAYAAELPHALAVKLQPVLGDIAGQR